MKEKNATVLFLRKKYNSVSSFCRGYVMKFVRNYACRTFVPVELQSRKRILVRQIFFFHLILVIQQLTSSCSITKHRDGVLCRYYELPCPLHPMNMESARQRIGGLACLSRSSNLAGGWHNAFWCLVGCSNLPCGASSMS